MQLGHILYPLPKQPRKLHVTDAVLSSSYFIRQFFPSAPRRGSLTPYIFKLRTTYTSWLLLELTLTFLLLAPFRCVKTSHARCQYLFTMLRRTTNDAPCYIFTHYIHTSSWDCHPLADRYYDDVSINYVRVLRYYQIMSDVYTDNRFEMRRGHDEEHSLERRLES